MTTETRGMTKEQDKEAYVIAFLLRPLLSDDTHRIQDAIDDRLDKIEAQTKSDCASLRERIK